MTSPQPIGSPIDRVLAKVKHKGAGQGKWVAKCPAHDDRMESLSIRVGTDGRVLLKCHAGCGTRDVCGAIGLTMADLFAEGTKRESTGPDPRNRPRMVKSWPYTDADGNPLFEAVRYEFPLEPGDVKPKKKFSQRRKVDGEWVYNLDGVTPVLYRLPAVIEAVAMGRMVCVTEGEKAADVLVEAGFCATTNPMGALKWDSSYSKVLAGATVAVFPDNDATGLEHAEMVCKDLALHGCIVRQVKIPALPAKGDVVDYFARSDADSAEIEAMIERTPVWGPKRVIWKLSELWKNESIMRPPPHVVPRFGWVGRSTLLAAREKSGKSTLIGFIASRVSKGEQFLNEYCPLGDVLIVGLEEYLGDVARRLRHFGADGDRVVLMNGFLGEHPSRAAEIEAAVHSLMPTLVVVDSLVAFANDRGIDENDAAMASVVQPLTDMAHATGTALVIVHHANKAHGKARGSTAIMGATDVVIEFFAPDEDADPTRRRVRSVGRVPLIRQYDLDFDGDSYRLLDGDKAPLEQRIVTVLTNRPAISTNDVAAAVGGNKADVISTLHRMQAERALTNQSTSFARAKWVVTEKSLL